MLTPVLSSRSRWMSKISVIYASLLLVPTTVLGDVVAIPAATAGPALVIRDGDIDLRSDLSGLIDNVASAKELDARGGYGGWAPTTSSWCPTSTWQPTTYWTPTSSYVPAPTPCCECGECEGESTAPAWTPTPTPCCECGECEGESTAPAWTPTPTPCCECGECEGESTAPAWTPTPTPCCECGECGFSTSVYTPAPTPCCDLCGECPKTSVDILAQSYCSTLHVQGGSLPRTAQGQCGTVLLVNNGVSWKQVRGVGIAVSVGLMVGHLFMLGALQ